MQGLLGEGGPLNNAIQTQVKLYFQISIPDVLQLYSAPQPELWSSRTTITILTFENTDEFLQYGHWSESYSAVLSVVLFFMLYKAILTFESVDNSA